MRRTPVSSSNLRSVGYDASQLVLECEFADGSVYQYFDVTGAVWAGLMGAASIGKYHRQHIYSAFRFRRL